MAAEKGSPPKPKNPETAVVPATKSHYLEYQSKRKQFLVESYPQLDVPGILKIINDCLFYDDINLRVSKSPSPTKEDFLDIGLAIAHWASEQTQSLLKRGNFRTDIESTKGYSKFAIDHIRRLKDDLLKIPNTGKPTPLCYELAKFAGQGVTIGHIETVIRPLLALYYGVGNCCEYATVAMQCVSSALKATGGAMGAIEDVAIFAVTSESNGNKNADDSHAYMVLRIKNKDELLICDPWNNIVAFKDKLNKDQGLILSDTIYQVKSKPFLPFESQIILKTLVDHGFDVFDLLKNWQNNSKVEGPSKNLMDTIRAKFARIESLKDECAHVLEQINGKQPGWLFSELSKQQQTAAAPTDSAAQAPAAASANASAKPSA